MPTSIQIEQAILARLNAIKNSNQPNPNPTLCYSVFAAQMGHPGWRIGKRELDPIAQRYTSQNPPLPDITVILVKKPRNSKQGYPSQIDGKDTRFNITSTDKAKARAKLAEVIKTYCPNADNPY